MFKPSPQTTIQFILERSTLDIPPPGWAASSPARHLTGILRISIPTKAAPLKADRISIDLYGLLNGVRDSRRNLLNTTATSGAGAAAALVAGPMLAGGSQQIFGEGMVDMTFVVWQPKDDAELEAGLSAGIHDFPFSITIPMHILPTFNVRIRPNFASSLSANTNVPPILDPKSVLTHLNHGAPSSSSNHTQISTIHPPSSSVPLSSSSSSNAPQPSSSSTSSRSSANSSATSKAPTDPVLVKESRAYELCAIVHRRGSSKGNLVATCPIVVRQCFPRWQVADDPGRVGRGATVSGEFHVKLKVPRLAFIEDEFASILVTVQEGTCSVKNITAIKCVLSETSSYKRSKGTSSTTVNLGNVMNYPIENDPKADPDAALLSAKNPLEVVVSLRYAKVDLSTSILSVEHSIILQIEHRVQLPGGAYRTALATFQQPAAPAPAPAGTKKMVFDEQTDIIVPQKNFFFSNVGKKAVPAPSVPQVHPMAGNTPVMVEMNRPVVPPVTGPAPRPIIDFEARLLAHQQMSSRKSPQPATSSSSASMTSATNTVQHSTTASTFTSNSSMFSGASSIVPSLAASSAPSLSDASGGVSVTPNAGVQPERRRREDGTEVIGDDVVSLLMDAELTVPIRVVHAAHPEDEAMMAIAPVEPARSSASSVTASSLMAGRSSLYPNPAGGVMSGAWSSPAAAAALAAYQSFYPHNPNLFATPPPASAPFSTASPSTPTTSSLSAAHPSLRTQPYQPSSGGGNNSSSASTYSSYNTPAGYAHAAAAAAGYASYATPTASTSSSVYQGRQGWKSPDAASNRASSTPLADSAASAMSKPWEATQPSYVKNASVVPTREKTEDEVVVHEPVETPYVCVTGYEPTGTCVDGDELRIRPGEHVIVSDIFDDGWAVGTNLNSSTAGFFLVSKVTFDRTLVDPSSRMGSALRLDEDDDEDAKLGSASPTSLNDPDIITTTAPIISTSPQLMSPPPFPLNPALLISAAIPSPSSPPPMSPETQNVMMLQSQIEQMRLMMERMEASLKVATAAVTASAGPAVSGIGAQQHQQAAALQMLMGRGGQQQAP